MSDRNQHLGDDQLVHGMPKHMVGVTKMGQKSADSSSKPSYSTAIERKVYILRAKPNACGLCHAVSGVPYDEIPITHPNCRCSVEEKVVETLIEDEQKKADNLLRKSPNTRAEIEEWLEELSKIDLSQLDKKTQAEIIRRLEEYEAEPGWISRLGVKAARSASMIIQNNRKSNGWLPPLPKFIAGTTRG